MPSSSLITMSVYSPLEVVRNVPFQLLVFVCSGSDRKRIARKAKRWQTGAVLRNEQVVGSCASITEMTITLSFFPSDAGRILIQNGGVSRRVQVSSTECSESFVVNVLPEYSQNGLVVGVGAEVNGAVCLNHSFDLRVVSNEVNAVPVDAQWNAVLPESPHEQYRHIFKALLFGDRLTRQFMKYTHADKDVVTGHHDAGTSYDLKELLYANGMYLSEAQKVVAKVESELAILQKDCGKNPDIGMRLLPWLLCSLCSVRDETERFEELFRRYEASVYCDVKPLMSYLEPSWIGCMLDLKTLRDQAAMLRELVIVKRLTNKEKKGRNGRKVTPIIKKAVREHATLFYERVEYFGTDMDLFNFFKGGGTKSLIHSKTEGEVTLAFLGLFIAMVLGEYVSVDNGKEDWLLNVEDFIDLSAYHGSLRIPRQRINRTVKLLEQPEVRGKIMQYQRSRTGCLSVAAYFLMKVKLRMARTDAPAPL